MSGKRTENLSSLECVLNSGIELLEKIEDTLRRMSRKFESKVNYHLMRKEFYYDSGHMRLKDGTEFFRNDLPEGCELYSELSQYCYTKVNQLLEDGRIRYRKGKFVIVD